jgi:hypothetical protein
MSDKAVAAAYRSDDPNFLERAILVALNTLPISRTTLLLPRSVVGTPAMSDASPITVYLGERYCSETDAQGRTSRPMLFAALAIDRTFKLIFWTILGLTTLSMVLAGIVLLGGNDQYMRLQPLGGCLLCATFGAGVLLGLLCGKATGPVRRHLT